MYTYLKGLWPLILYAVLGFSSEPWTLTAILLYIYLLLFDIFPQLVTKGKEFVCLIRCLVHSTQSSTWTEGTQ